MIFIKKKNSMSNLKNKIQLSGYLIYLIGIIIFFLSFYLNLDGYGKPLSGDFRDTWPYVLKLNENFWIDPSPWTLHFPLHYFLLAKSYLIIGDAYFVRIFFLGISLLTPYLFYLCLKKKHKINSNSLLIISSLILFTPSFVYSAVWANDNNLSYIFILLGTLFHLKNDNLDNTVKNGYLILTFIFFALACYSRQYYAVLYGYFILSYFSKLSFRKFLIITILSALLASPGIIFLYNFPALYGDLAFSGNASNTIIGNLSSLSVYTFPIFFVNLLFNHSELFNLKKFIKKLLISIIIFFLLFYFHNVQSMGQNGGIFFIYSNSIFKNYYLFYIISFINLFVIINLFSNKYDLFILFSIILMISGIIVLQKYFEPLFYIFFFLYSGSKYKNIFLHNSNALFILIFLNFIYFTISLTDIVSRI
jgi:hypothetical protein